MGEEDLTKAGLVLLKNLHRSTYVRHTGNACCTFAGRIARTRRKGQWCRAIRQQRPEVNTRNGNSREAFLGSWMDSRATCASLPATMSVAGTRQVEET